MEGCNTAEEVLLKLKSFRIAADSVSNVLASNVFTKDMMATYDGVSQGVFINIISAVLCGGHSKPCFTWQLNPATLVSYQW